MARFGPALAWADRKGADHLDVLVDGGGPAATGIVARRAACFEPAPSIWAVDGRDLAPAVPADPVPEPAPGPPAAPGAAAVAGASPGVAGASAPAGEADPGSPDPSLPGLLASHGLEVVSEHGVLRGEVLGLEVARTVGGRLQVGVGRHDRMARQEMRPGESASSALAEAAQVVRSLRTLDAPPHPANTLARARWLRAILVHRPSVVGLSALTPVAPPLPWFDLPEAGAAPAVGTNPADGGRVVVVCSVGVELDLVPTAADCRLLYGDSAESSVWLIVPEGDDLPVTRSLASRLAAPAEIRVVPRRWQELAG